MAPQGKLQLSNPAGFIFLVLLLLLQINTVFSFNASASTLQSPNRAAGAQFINHVYYDCSPAQQNILRTEFGTAYSALRAAGNRLERIERAFFSRQPGPNDLIEGQDRSAIRTFEAIFGRIYYGSGDARNTWGYTILRQLFARVYAFLNAFSAPTNHRVEVWCGVNWMSIHDPGTGELLEPDKAWDMRPANRGGQSYLKGANCVTTQSALAVTFDIPDSLMHGKFGIINICALAFQVISGSSVEDLKEELSEGIVTLDDISSDHLFGTLIHELSHMSTLIHKDFETDDIIAEHANGHGQHDAYGWGAITTHAQRADQSAAINNADNFAFFVVAMYLGEYDWARGYNLDIPGDMRGFGPLPVGPVVSDAGSSPGSNESDEHESERREEEEA